MKLRTTIAGVAAALLLGTLTTTMFAQTSSAPGPKGRGYGGPPKTEEERAARQQACPQECGQGTCPQGGPRGQGFCRGQGRGNGGGYGYRHGLRDGTGPRSQNGSCPAAGGAAKPAK